MSTAKPDIVTPEQWRAAREALLVKEKAHTRARDTLAAERRRMPMIRVEKDYRFTAPGGGDATLLDLFDGSRQLVLYRFFMDPDMDVYPERGCPGCSMYADQLGNLLHLRERDTRFVAVSRGEQEHLGGPQPLGDDLARGLGENVVLARATVAVGVAVLCGASTALAGPIGFLGLVVPHVARFVVGPDHRRIIPACLVAGPTLLLAADVVGRLVAHPSEVQAGIMTAVVGVPFFVVLVRRGRMASL